MQPEPDPATVQAELAIRKVLAGYCRGLDRMDEELARSTWHPDGTALYHGVYEGSGAGFVEWVWPVHQQFLGHSHQITNVFLQIDAPAGTAASESYVTVCLRLPDGEGGLVDMVTRGRYVDTWSRRDGRWAIDHRVYVSDLSNQHPVAAGDGQDSLQGARDRSDPSYQALD